MSKFFTLRVDPIQGSKQLVLDVFIWKDADKQGEGEAGIHLSHLQCCTNLLFAKRPRFLDIVNTNCSRVNKTAQA